MDNYDKYIYGKPFIYNKPYVIVQADETFGDDNKGKWFCGIRGSGFFGTPEYTSYLGSDGKWGQLPHYFDDENMMMCLLARNELVHIRIEKVDYKSHVDEMQGKWWCSKWIMGTDNERVIRYLHPDGSWKQHTGYFDTKETLEAVLTTSPPPDFNVDWRENYSRQAMRDMAEEMFSEPVNEIAVPDDHPTDDGYEIGPYQIM